MNLDFTEEQTMLRDSLRSICAAKSNSHAVRQAELDPATAMRGVWRELAEAGFLGLGIDEAHGGSALGMIEAAIAAHEFGRFLVHVPHFESAFFAARLIAAAGTQEQCNRWLPNIADGTLVIVPAWLEEGGHDDIARLSLVLKRKDDGLILSGRKVLVTFAGSAQKLLVLTRHPDILHGYALACVDIAKTGISLLAQPNLASAPLYTVEFDEVTISPGDVVGYDADVSGIWNHIFLEGLIPLAAQAVGGAEQVLEMTIAYAKEREQFDQPIGSFQAIAHNLADAATELEAARVLAWQAAWAHAEGLDFERLAITAKLFACRAFRRISALAIQVHGGLGFTSDADPQLYFRRAKHQQLFHGSSRWLETQLARRVIAGDIPVLN